MAMLNLPPKPTGAPQVSTAPMPKFSLSTPRVCKTSRTAIYGSGGTGKTTLAAHAIGDTAFIDLDKSIGVLMPKLTAQGVGDRIVTVDGIETWDHLMAALLAPIYDDVQNICIDTVTRAQELAAAWVPKNIRGEKGQVYNTLTDFPWGDGYNHLYEVFLHLFQACDDLVAKGKNVILVCHECTSTVPNPEGQEFLRYEPSLSSPKSGKGSIRLKMKEWCDNLLFIQNGKNVDKDGKATGTNQRMVYPTDQAWAMAKSRIFDEPFLLEGFGEDMWKRIQG